TFLYAKGLVGARPSSVVTMLGSCVAGLAFLSRPQGALVVVAVVGFLIATRLPTRRLDRRLLAQVVAVPVLMVVGFYLWLIFVNGVPKAQSDFSLIVKEASLRTSWTLFRKLSFLQLAY